MEKIIAKIKENMRLAGIAKSEAVNDENYQLAAEEQAILDTYEIVLGMIKP